MKGRKKTNRLKDATNVELLNELLSRNRLMPSRTNSARQGNWFEAVIDIGKDETARICMSSDAVVFLESDDHG